MLPRAGPISGSLALLEVAPAAVGFLDLGPRQLTHHAGVHLRRRSRCRRRASSADHCRRRSIDDAFAGSLAAHRADTLRFVEEARERGELAADADGELLLDLLDGALYYRLLWRNQRFTEAEVEPLVDRVLATFGR